MVNHFLKTFRNYILIPAIPLMVGAFLFFYSDAPPYGYANNELSNNYWGIIVDIARKWRTMEFSFWDKGVSLGMSLFTSGQYPILNPTNVFALFLTNDQFYLFKLIEPYFWGVLFMLILLNKQYKLSLPISIFGSLFYMGQVFSRHSIMLESPFFLWGISLFPLMVIAMERYIKKDIYLSAALVGVVVAWMFAGEGVIQVPQLIIWWTIFYSIYIFKGLFKGAVLRSVKKWLFCIGLLVMMSIGIFAVQFVPTYEFVTNVASTRTGHYSINNFPLWLSPADIDPLLDLPETLLDFIVRGFVTPGGVSGYGFGVLVFGVMWLIILDPNKAKNVLISLGHLNLIWIATAVFFVMPSFVVTLARWLPFLKEYFSFFSQVTFKYGLHILDFCFAVTICLFLDKREIAFRMMRGPRDVFVSAPFVVIICVFLFAPVMLKLFGGSNLVFPSAVIFFKNFIPSNFKTASIVLFLNIFSLLYLLLHQRNLTLKLVSWVSLILLGFMMTITSYHWNDKGRLTADVSAYCWDCPEHVYFRQAKGKNYFSLDSTHRLRYPRPIYMVDNYGLLHGVYSRDAFMPLRSERSLTFFNNYKIDGSLSAAPSYFPIDFTTCAKTEKLNWEGFQVEIQGEEHNIYENKKKTKMVFFADNLVVMPLDELLKEAFHKPPSRNLYIAESDLPFLKDNEKMNLPNGMSGNYYSHFEQIREDFLRFKVAMFSESFAVVPEMFQKGWHVKIDDRPADIFPANFLFIGFRLPLGEHQVEMRFIPPKIFIGALFNVFSLFSLFSLVFRYQISKHKSAFL